MTESIDISGLLNLLPANLVGGLQDVTYSSNLPAEIMGARQDRLNQGGSQSLNVEVEDVMSVLDAYFPKVEDRSSVRPTTFERSEAYARNRQLVSQVVGQFFPEVYKPRNQGSNKINEFIEAVRAH